MQVIKYKHKFIEDLTFKQISSLSRPQTVEDVLQKIGLKVGGRRV